MRKALLGERVDAWIRGEEQDLHRDCKQKEHEAREVDIRKRLILREEQEIDQICEDFGQKHQCRTSF